MKFADRLKYLRENKGLSQNALAKAISTHHSRISRYELGTSNPRPDMMVKLAGVLDVSVDFLKNGDSTNAEESNLDIELLELFKKTQVLSNKKKNTYINVIKAFLTEK